MAKILLVDDEQYIRRYYSEALSEEGYEVISVATGHNLLQKIDIIKPDLVVLDIRLVDYDGLELLQDIRNEYHDMPVVICSAYDTYKNDPRTIAADYYVVKSFDLSELKGSIKRAIEACTSPAVLDPEIMVSPDSYLL